MRLQGVMQPLKDNMKFKSITEKISEKTFPINIYGISESGKSYIINGIFEENDNSMVIVTHSDVDAKNLYEDLSFYTTDVFYFPVREVVFYNVDAISGDLRWARLKVIKEILQNERKKIIVTSIDSLTSLYTPKEYYLRYSMIIKTGDNVDLKEISKSLLQCGYERVEVVEGKGEFSFRGGILDVFPPTSAYPYRVELFGDEVDSIRTFNTESQRSIEKVKEFSIFPSKEVIVDDEGRNRAVQTINEELKNIVANVSNLNKESVENGAIDNQKAI